MSKITPCDFERDENGLSVCPFDDVSESERCRVCCGLGVDEDEYPEEEEDEYCPSSTNGDYSPNNPWDAPGMKLSDFI